jgi:alpha,alpha-trehalose phosphorylase
VLEVTATHSEAKYELVVGDEVTIRHHGKSLEVRAGEPITEPIPAIEPGPRPSQPHGREPLALTEGE